MLTPGEVDEFFAVVRSLIDAGQVDRVHHPQAARGARGRRPHHRAAARARRRHEPIPSAATQQSLATLMVGRDVSFEIDKPPAQPGRAPCWKCATSSSPTTAASRLGRQASTSTVREGEIFGIAGVEGNGQRELVEAIAGMRTPVERHHRDQRRRRHRRGAAADARARRRPRARGPQQARHRRRVHHRRQPRAEHLLPQARSRGAASAQLRAIDDAGAASSSQRYDIRTPSIHSPVSNLSGGNQQKVIIARELTDDLKLLLVAQPTRGLDVGSIEFIHRRIVEMRDAGTAVLLVSRRARRDLHALRPHRRALPRRARRRVRPGRRDPRRSRTPHGVRAARRQRGSPREHEDRRHAAATRCSRVITRYFDLQPVLVPICAILLAFAVGGVIILLVGENPITAYWALLRGMFGAPGRGSRHRSAGRRRSSAPRSRSRSRSAPACSTSASRASS